MEAVIADQKTTSLSAFTPAASDLLYGVDDPGGTPVSGKFTIEALLDVLKAPYTKTNEGLISFTQTLTGSDNSVALYLEGQFNTSGSTSLIDLAIDDTASAATTTFIICERLDGGTVSYWELNKDGTTRMRDGSAASPILTFLSDPDTGLFRVGANELGFAAGGTQVAALGADGFTTNLKITKTIPTLFLNDGVAGDCGLRFSTGSSALVVGAPNNATDKNIYFQVLTGGALESLQANLDGGLKDIPVSSGTTGGTGSAGSGNQYVELYIGGTTYKVLHDGTV